RTHGNEVQRAAGNPFPTQQNGRPMDRPTVRPNFNVIAAHMSSVAAHLSAREISDIRVAACGGRRRGAYHSLKPRRAKRIFRVPFEKFSYALSSLDFGRAAVLGGEKVRSRRSRCAREWSFARRLGRCARANQAVVT